MHPHVVILSAFLSPFRSGAEACVEEVAHRLVARYSITIVTARLRRDVPRVGVLPPPGGRGLGGGDQGIPLLRIGFGSPFDKWLFPFLAPFVVRKLRPDIVHAVLETFAGAALLLCRFVYPQAQRILTLQTTNRSFLKCPVIRAAHRVTAISSVLVEAAKRCGKEAAFIPNGVDYTAIREACARYPKMPGRILFVGRLEKMKGVDTLLAAFAQLPVAPTINPPPPVGERGGPLPSPVYGGRAGVGGNLRVVGDGSLRKQLLAFSFQFSAAHNIHFVGYLPVPELYKEFAEAEIFCALPRSEAMGNVFLEAQAAGCAVLGTRVGGVPDVVLHGKTGILLAPEDPQVAATTLALLLKDAELRQKLSSAAVAHAEKYDWSGIAEQYAAMYAKIL